MRWSTIIATPRKISRVRLTFAPTTRWRCNCVRKRACVKAHSIWPRPISTPPSLSIRAMWNSTRPAATSSKAAAPGPWWTSNNASFSRRIQRGLQSRPDEHVKTAAQEAERQAEQGADIAVAQPLAPVQAASPEQAQQKANGAADQAALAAIVEADNAQDQHA